MSEPSPFRLIDVKLEEREDFRRTREMEHEREIALYDLLEANSFKPMGSPGGPYELILRMGERRLTFDVRLQGGEQHGTFILSLTPFQKRHQRIFRDLRQLFQSHPQRAFDAHRIPRYGPAQHAQ